MRFQPLESNPESINEYLIKLGLSANYGLCDIIGFTPDLLPFVLKPVYAIIFLYPIYEPNLDADFSCLANETAEEREKKDLELAKDLFTIKQTISNACGTIALIHSIANNSNSLEFKEDSVLKEFIDKTLDKTPDERGKLLEANQQMANAHEECAESGETEMDINSPFHFVALIHHEGYLWKCDGRNDKKCIRVNTATKETILESAAEYVAKFAEKNPNLVCYSAMSLSKL